MSNHDKLIDIIKYCNKAYEYCKDKFYTYFENQLRMNLSLKYKYNYVNNIMNVQSRNKLHKLIDDAVRYKLELSTTRPDHRELLYSFAYPEVLELSVDEIFSKMIYGSYPIELTKEFADSLSVYIDNDDIRELMISKLEHDVE